MTTNANDPRKKAQKARLPVKPAADREKKWKKE